MRVLVASAFRRSRGAALAGAALAILASAGAAAQTYGHVDVSAGIVAASDPFLVGGNDTTAVGANITVDPSIYYEGDTTTLTLQGRVSVDQYFDRYGTDESVALRANGRHRLDERTTLSANSSFTSSRSVSRHAFGLGQLDRGGVGPGEFPEQPIIDPTLGGLGGRTTSLRVSTSLERLLSPTSSVQAGASFGLTRINQALGQDYRDAAITLGYSKRLSERSVALVNGEVSLVDYLNQPVGDGRLVTIMAGLERWLSDTLRVSGQVGVTAVWTDLPGGDSDQRSSFAASLDLCRQGARTNLCATGSRRAQPTLAGGISNVTALGLSYGRTVGVRGHASLSGNYGRSDRGFAPGSLLTGERSQVLGLAASYNHDLNTRMSAYITPSFSSASNRGLARRENYQVMLGIRYRLGRLR
jgi:hypothetical protein